MDYIAHFKYKKIIHTLYIPRYECCNATLNDIVALIYCWLKDKNFFMHLDIITDYIKDMNIMFGNDTIKEYIKSTTDIKVEFKLKSGELYIVMINPNVDTRLTYKKR